MAHEHIRTGVKAGLLALWEEGMRVNRRHRPTCRTQQLLSEGGVGRKPGCGREGRREQREPEDRFRQ